MVSWPGPQQLGCAWVYDTSPKSETSGLLVDFDAGLLFFGDLFGAGLQGRFLDLDAAKRMGYLFQPTLIPVDLSV